MRSYSHSLALVRTCNDYSRADRAPRSLSRIEAFLLQVEIDGATDRHGAPLFA